jgi:glycosyltransferase involved in cell wall biosynthesis
MALVEAGVLGVPAIASDHGAIPELIEHGSTGLLFTPGDADALAACVDRMAAQPELAVLMGDAARRRCLTAYSAAENYRQLRAIYMRAIRDNLPVLELTAPMAKAAG